MTLILVFYMKYVILCDLITIPLLMIGLWYFYDVGYLACISMYFSVIYMGL